MQNEKITINMNTLKVAMGHQAHIGGNGRHQDSRTKRKRTRQAALQAALRNQA